MKEGKKRKGGIVKEYPSCAECGSKEFVLVKLVEFDIEFFDEHDEPINFSNKEVLESEIKCSQCRTPKGDLKAKAVPNTLNETA